MNIFKNNIKRYSDFIQNVLSARRAVKRLIVLLFDCSFCFVSVWLAYFLRLGEFVALSEAELIAALISVILAIPIFYSCGLYKTIFRYNGMSALMSVAMAMAIYGIFYALLFTIIGMPGTPRTIGIIQPILLLIFVVGLRSSARLWLGNPNKNLLKKTERPNVLIYGAGNAGRQLAAAISNSMEMRVVGFLDDDERLQGNILNGLLIYNPAELANLIDTLEISDILLAMHSITRRRRNLILNKLGEAQVSVRTLPSFVDLAKGKVTVSDVRELDIDDLLGRETVEPNKSFLAKNITGKIVMVTGAGGSIGSELCRQIVELRPKKLLLVEQSEFALYEIHQELESRNSDVNVISLLASVQDANRMNEVISTWCPHIVYHAAAYKHVPLVEHNLSEGLKNNVLGTMVTVNAAITHRVKNFVLISTDKAVRPTNIMGASKRLAEIVLQALASENSSTKLSMVRFGNVLGSSGSVVPKFRQQIKEGGPVTITHPEITRFFMTIPEASQLVIQAGAMATGGDVFVLDMGQPVKIKNLAERMIELSGLSVKNEQNPSGDIKIEVTKLRPGEKLYEELLIGDNPEPTSHNRIMKAHESFIPWDNLEGEINRLTVALNANDVNTIRHLLEALVPDYSPSRDIVDWVYLERKK